MLFIYFSYLVHCFASFAELGHLHSHKSVLKLLYTYFCVHMKTVPYYLTTLPHNLIGLHLDY